MRYGELLDTIRAVNPQAAIVCLSAFCGAFDSELGTFVVSYNEKNGSNVHYISSKGWVPAEPLHPLRQGHRIIAEKLAAELKKIL